MSILSLEDSMYELLGKVDRVCADISNRKPPIVEAWVTANRITVGFNEQSQLSVNFCSDDGAILNTIPVSCFFTSEAMSQLVEDSYTASQNKFARMTAPDVRVAFVKELKETVICPKLNIEYVIVNEPRFWDEEWNEEVLVMSFKMPDPNALARDVAKALQKSCDDAASRHSKQCKVWIYQAPVQLQPNIVRLAWNFR